MSVKDQISTIVDALVSGRSCELDFYENDLTTNITPSSVKCELDSHGDLCIELQFNEDEVLEQIGISKVMEFLEGEGYNVEQY